MTGGGGAVVVGSTNGVVATASAGSVVGRTVVVGLEVTVDVEGASGSDAAPGPIVVEVGAPDLDVSGVEVGLPAHPVATSHRMTAEDSDRRVRRDALRTISGQLNA
jgi:hypothetical protein